MKLWQGLATIGKKFPIEDVEQHLEGDKFRCVSLIPKTAANKHRNMLKKRQSGNEGVVLMPKCCNKIHVGWICPVCGTAMTMKSPCGNKPVSIGKIKNVTIVQRLYKRLCNQGQCCHGRCTDF